MLYGDEAQRGSAAAEIYAIRPDRYPQFLYYLKLPRLKRPEPEKIDSGFSMRRHRLMVLWPFAVPKSPISRLLSGVFALWQLLSLAIPLLILHFCITAYKRLMIGPPGSGKSMIAKRIPSIIPEPALEEFLEILRIQSAAGRTISGDLPWFQRPYRAPHHTISDAGLLGGGSIPGPGEVSLAHNGVLFLDELPEFKRSALEVLRQPLEDGAVTISRSAGKVTLPCYFMLVAAMNPCPCGYLGDAKHECRCGSTQIQRYRSKISGPLLDRIDIHVEAPALSIEELRNAKPGEASAPIRARIQEARRVQRERLAKADTPCNARMSHAQIRDHCAIDRSLGDLLQQAMEQLSLSARAYDRILKVSRTIADLAGSPEIQAPHLLEAIQYRSLDRNIFY